MKETVRCRYYVLWCAYQDIDRRMPDDFSADAALILSKPEVFTSRFANELRKIWSGVKIKVGPVTYYAPCSFVHRNEKPVHLSTSNSPTNESGTCALSQRPTRCPLPHLTST